MTELTLKPSVHVVNRCGATITSTETVDADGAPVITIFVDPAPAPAAMPLIRSFSSVIDEHVAKGLQRAMLGARAELGSRRMNTRY